MVTKFIRENAMRKLSNNSLDDESTKSVLFQDLVDGEMLDGGKVCDEN